MPVTLKGIAERVGKSIPTVSRALAGFEGISSDIREEVRRVAREMGYVPNITARNLQKQRTDTIALNPAFIGLPESLRPFLQRVPIRYPRPDHSLWHQP